MLKCDFGNPHDGYYQQEIASLFNLLIPKGVSVLEIDALTGDPSSFVGSESDKKFDYIVLNGAVDRVNDLQLFFFNLQKFCHPRTRIVFSYYNYLWKPLFLLASKILRVIPPLSVSWLPAVDFENLLHISNFETVKKGAALFLSKHIPFVSFFLNRFLARVPLFGRLCLFNYAVVRPKPLAQFLASKASVSIIVPAKDERGNIESIVQRTPQIGSHTEIIFVEGNSTDSTWEEMKRVKELYPGLDIKIMRQDGKGKGDAVRKGFDLATGDILMILDSDLAVSPEDLQKFYQVIIFGLGEFINGSRLVYQMEKGSMRLLNFLGNKFFAILCSWILDQQIKDALCGTKVMWRDDYEKIKTHRSFFGDFDPFGDFDLLFGAGKLNLKIVDVPIFYRARTYGATNISRFRHGWLLLKMCFFVIKKLKFRSYS